jgi:hypothetical protein
MSSGAASSWCATTFLALSTIFVVALAIAWPPTASERDPYVPSPCGPVPVSPCMTSICCGSIPSRSATICANDVSSPCPCGDVPE